MIDRVEADLLRNALKRRHFGATIDSLFPEEISLHTDAAGTAPPEAFGPFRVLHQIGAGALGPVFRAFDPDHDRLVAVKLFRLDLPPERVHQLVAEFERLIAAGVKHPAVIAPLATGIAGVNAYLAQDYVVAESLDITLRQGPSSAADALRISTQLAGALDAAAALDIAHGVLHPRDVLLSAEGTRLTGLGIARAVERVGVPAQVRRPYTAPERTAGPEWDRRADVFGLAAMIHEILWGRRVAGVGEEAAAALTEIAGGDLPRLRSVFGRALAEDPGGRFETATEFAGALKQAFARSVRRQPDRSVGLQLDRDLERDSEPRLPLEAPAASTLGLFEPDSRRFAVIDAPDSGDALDAIRAADTGRATGILNLAERQPVLPPELSELYRPSSDGVRDEERSRSTISPLAFALLIGAALGFAAGFGVGTWGRSPDTDEPRTPEAPVASNTNPETGETREGPSNPAREFTDTEVPVRPNTATPSSLEDRAADRRSPGAGERQDRRAAAPKPAPPAPIVGSLLVRSTPLGARVLVDGREYGRTPLTVGNLSRGAHNVRVIRDGYDPDNRQVTVTSAQRAHSMTVRLSPQRVAPVGTVASAASAASRPAAPAALSAAPLTVESLPAGAAVFLDGRPVGTTPLVVPDVAAGEHAIHLEREGYQRWSSAIRIVTTEKNRVTASLDR